MALVTNPSFVDAFLVGANQQTPRRAAPPQHPRHHRLDAAATLLAALRRRPDPATDIEPVVDVLTTPAPGTPGRTRAARSATTSHQRSDRPAQLVVLLHTELFRRYPATQVYLVGQPGRRGDLGRRLPRRRRPDGHAGATRAVRHAAPGAGVLRVPAAPPRHGKSHWLVLEEPPPGYRFKAPTSVQR